MVNIDELKKILEEEKKKLEDTLGSLGHEYKKDGASDWEASYPDLNPMVADKSEIADGVEEFEVRLGMEGNLESRLIDVKNALLRITEGTYGKCMECKKDIEEERLQANPAAKTCIKHAKK